MAWALPSPWEGRGAGLENTCTGQAALCQGRTWDLDAAGVSSRKLKVRNSWAGEWVRWPESGSGIWGRAWGGEVQTQGSVDLEGVWTPERTEAWKGLISTRSQGCGKSLDSESNRAESGVPGGGNTRSWPGGTEDRGGAECGETEGASEAWTNLEGVSSLDL